MRGAMILSSLSSLFFASAFQPATKLLQRRGLHRSVALMAVNEISAQQLKCIFDGDDVPASASVLNADDCQFIDCREVHELVIANYPKPGVEAPAKWGAKGGLMMNLPLSTMQVSDCLIVPHIFRNISITASSFRPILVRVGDQKSRMGH